MSTLDVKNLGLHGLIDPDASVERIAGGLGFTEGPVWLSGGETGESWTLGHIHGPGHGVNPWTTLGIRTSGLCPPRSSRVCLR